MGTNAGEGAEVEGVFGVHAGSGGPAFDGALADDQRNSVDRERPFRNADDEERTAFLEPAGNGFDGRGGGNGREDDLAPPSFWSSAAGSWVCVVDVDVGAELAGEIGFVLLPRPMAIVR